MDPLISRFIGVIELLLRVRARSRGELKRRLPAGASVGDLYVLDVILAADLIAMGDLARRLGITPATATAAANRLVRNGWVVRVPDQDDRRVIRLAVTPHGRRMHEGYEVHREQLATSVLSRLSRDEATTLVNLLERIAVDRHA